jgi:hypothetical protein
MCLAGFAFLFLLCVIVILMWTVGGYGQVMDEYLSLRVSSSRLSVPRSLLQVLHRSLSLSVAVFCHSNLSFPLPINHLGSHSLYSVHYAPLTPRSLFQPLAESHRSHAHHSRHSSPSSRSSPTTSRAMPSSSPSREHTSAPQHPSPPSSLPSSSFTSPGEKRAQRSTTSQANAVHTVKFEREARSSPPVSDLVPATPPHVSLQQRRAVDELLTSPDTQKLLHRLRRMRPDLG